MLRDEFQVFAWDGITRDIEAHNADQTLRSAMRSSALWVYQGFAQALGEPAAAEYLQKIGYGNADPSTAQGNYWVDGQLAISAHEQVGWLGRMAKRPRVFCAQYRHACTHG